MDPNACRRHRRGPYAECGTEVPNQKNGHLRRNHPVALVNALKAFTSRLFHFAAPHASFGRGPIVKASVPPFTMSAWRRNGRSSGAPLSSADWM